MMVVVVVVGIGLPVEKKGHHSGAVLLRAMALSFFLLSFFSISSFEVAVVEQTQGIYV